MNVDPLIDAARLHEVFTDCLFRADELLDGKPSVEPVVVEAVMHNFGFHPARLESHRAEIKDMLDGLPEPFMPDSGGGWSFLQAAADRNGVQWGEHVNMEQLFALGIGLGMAKWLLPRDMWGVLPGGMPYVSVDTRG